MDAAGATFEHDSATVRRRQRRAAAPATDGRAALARNLT